MYANVIIDITHEKLDRVFQYRIPPAIAGEIFVGTKVTVPFGRSNRETDGYVIGFTDTPDYEVEKIKEIHGKAKGSVPIESCLIELAAWMKDRYGGTMIQSLKTVLPIKTEKKRLEKKTVRLLLSTEEAKKKLDYFLLKNQKARARVLAGLLDQPIQESDLITKKLRVSLSVLRALEEQGILKIESKEIFRNPIRYDQKKQKEVIFNEEQRKAIQRFVTDYERGKRGTYLLYGVTGSGKTEVYMEMISRVIRDGKQVIVLIPEIALTYQTVLRFYGRFGDRVAIINSKMSAGERSDQMERVKRGEADVMIGPRSALFTPFKNLGLIVMDEEHEPSYKSEQIPRYHAREVAAQRAHIEGASVVLGSATPSLEAYYQCQTGESTLLPLKNRVSDLELPQVYTVDMREELKKGNRSILSDKLEELIEDRLQKKQQIMLFLNRRGYAGFVSCRSCGYVVKCPHCDVSMSLHNNKKLVCHYCGYERPQISVCPSCGSEYVGGFRAGTQQIEALVKKRFPTARVLRMDMDTTRQKDGHEKILSAFANEEADILIGTQMIVKGHDFGNVTLVGILAADLSLYSSDYRSGERTFQLLTQAAGRAGRGKAPGEVVIQTYSPDHYSIEMAARQDYEGFYEQEMQYRRMLSYPPVDSLYAVLMTGSDEEYLTKAAEYLIQFGKKVDKKQMISIIGPAKPFVGKVNDEYRRIIYLKCEDLKYLIAVKNILEQYIEINKGFESLRIQFDFNPMGQF